MNGMALVQTETATSVDVIEALAAATGRDPLAMDPPLNDVVDCDALDALLDSGESVTVSFDYDGHSVTVDGRGHVSVDGGA